jgi:hypothetical protein
MNRIKHLQLMQGEEEEERGSLEETVTVAEEYQTAGRTSLNSDVFTVMNWVTTSTMCLLHNPIQVHCK